MSERNKSALTFLASLVTLSAAWEAISRAGFVNPLVLPSPERHRRDHCGIT
jgi:ABC-type nitrate/sulfonate/bicarbonate transport system permease component